MTAHERASNESDFHALSCAITFVLSVKGEYRFTVQLVTVNMISLLPRLSYGATPPYRNGAMDWG